jgi:predicted kinase
MMQKVIMTVGVPGCGKSTFAKEWLSEDPASRSRVNRDDIRAMVADKKQWGLPDFEKQTTSIQNAILWEHLKSGKDVIIDNTHTQPKYFAAVSELLQNFANQFNKTLMLSVKKFDVDYDECLRRNAAREARVPDEVISKMHDTIKKNITSIMSYSNKIIHPVKLCADPAAEPVVVCDIDGTLAEISHRDPYDCSNCIDDGVYSVVADAMFYLSEEYKAKRIIVTGRDEKWRGETEAWLELNNIPYDTLYMRKAGDTRKDSIVKHEIYQNEILSNGQRVIAVFDDRDSVVRMWRNNGIMCFQVNYGEF